ncbi:MAG: HdeD family acid-resistance protein [Pseudonocardia sp.]|nr:HdeD family acid-resistance protein [Pseudonocardia sp.]MBO0872871.1 HdeD family acid-resistance protein [Pseudonocardia sp.]
MSHVMGEGVTAALDPRAFVIRLGRAWGWYAFFGAVALVAGILALVWPGPTLLVLAVIFGAQLVVSGVFRLVGAIAEQDASGGTRALMAILGLLGLLVGLYALRHIMITVLALGLVLGIYWVIDGITELFVAIEHPGLPGRGWVAASGGLGIVAGVILLAWPRVSPLVLAFVVGIWLLCFGIMQLAIAFRLRRLTKA